MQDIHSARPDALPDQRIDDELNTRRTPARCSFRNGFLVPFEPAIPRR